MPATSTDKTSPFTRPLIVFLCAMACCALWGSAYPSIKIGYRLFEIAAEDPAAQILFAGMRFTLAGVLTLLMGSAIQRRPLIPQRTSWKYILILCLLQTVLQYVFFYIGLAHASGSKSSIINSFSVFIAIFISALIFHQETLTSRKIIGCLIGFAGVILVNIGSGSGGGMWEFQLNGEGFILISAVTYAMSSVCIKKFSQFEDPVVLSGSQFFVGGLIMIVIGYCLGGRVTTFTPSGLGLLLYMGFLSAAAYSLWGILLKYNPVSRIAVYSFMNPVFGVILSAVLLKESSAAGWKSIVALILISIGIFIVNRPAPGRSA